MTTSRAARVAPTQIFENYVFTRKVGPEISLFPIDASNMRDFEPVLGGGVFNTISSTTHIGFDFKFNQKTYDRFVVSTNGYVILREKSDLGAFSKLDYFTSNSDFSNDVIKNRFTTNGILVCPWYDALKNTYTDSSQISGITQGEILSLKRGISLPSMTLDPTSSGVKYLNSTHPKLGRCLVVRWRSLSSSYAFAAGSLLVFEVVFYENGLIEFGYDAKKKISPYLSTSFEGATIGIFVNDKLNDDSTYWRFRDMSLGLGHPLDSIRNKSRYGGAEYSSTYTDTNGVHTAKYNITMYSSDVDPIGAPAEILGRKSNWPGQENYASNMSFSPPSNLRKILPRNDIKILDSKSSYPRRGLTFGETKKNLFDDRNSLSFGTNSRINYPSMLPEQYMLDNGIVDLFGDFVLPGRSIPVTSEQFVEKKHLESHPPTPFVDFDRPDQDASVEDPFFTGNDSKFKKALGQHLRSKTHIRMELPIHHKLEMFPTSSAIYYYNKNSNGFFIPQAGNASKDIMDAKLATGDGTNFGLYRPEDARGFGPIGNQVASGSSTAPMEFGWASDDDFSFNATESLVRSAWAKQNRAPVMSRYYGKSVPNNPDYWSLEDETFTLPINQPFLLEKAIFEIPLQAGPGWLYDKTSATVPIGSASQNSFVSVAVVPPNQFTFVFKRKNLGLCPQAGDFAGPAITVSLFNQHFSGTESRKDLIMTGTIIPEGDNIRNVTMRQTWTDYYGSPIDDGLHPLYVFEPEGFLSFGASPSATIPSDPGGYFTGSVSVRMESGVSNGVLMSYQGYTKNLLLGELPNPAGSISFAKELLTSPYIDLAGKFDAGNDACANSSFLKTTDVFGRNFRGAESSGRSIFGSEFIIPQTPINLNRTTPDSYVPNPLYVSSYEEMPDSFKEVLDINNSPDFRFYTQFVVPVSNSTPSPYLIKPGDKLTLAISKMRPALASNGYDPISGLKTLDIFKGGLEHDVLINTGSIKVTFYGSFIQNDVEHNESSNQILDTSAVHEVIGMEPILDQFDNEYMSSLRGSYLDDYITGSMLASYPYPAGSRGRLFSKQSASIQPPLPTSGYHLMADPSFSSRKVPWNEVTSPTKNLTLVDSNERIYDSMMPNFSEIFQRDGVNPVWLDFAGFPSNLGVFSFRGKVLGEENINGNTSWASSFPFETKYDGIRRQFDIKDRLIANSFIDDSGGAGELPPGGQKNIDSIFVEYEPYLLFVDANASNVSQIIGLNKNDFTKLFFGYGDFYFSGSDFSVVNIPNFRTVLPLGLIAVPISPVIRGWKYGIYNAFPSYSSLVFRRDKYGQFRDMLEQRLSTVPSYRRDFPIEVKFVDGEGTITRPELTKSFNLSTYATSSRPFEDRDVEAGASGNAFNLEVVPIFPNNLFTIPQ